MKYRMIVSDFDGTLLRSDNTVSAATRRAIAAFIAAGGIFTVSTGRNYPSIKRRIPDVGLEKLDIPVMSLQGSFAVNNLTGEEIFAEFIDKNVLAEFCELCRRDGIYVHIYNKYEVFTERKDAHSQAYERLTSVEVKEVGDLSRFISENDGFIKALAVCDGGKSDYYASKWGEAMRGKASVLTTAPDFAECIPLSSGKGPGLARVAKMLGIDVSGVIAVGDEMNDVGMIETAGLGVAVANAKPRVKEAADYITASNDEDGICRLIEKFCPEVL